VLLARVVGNVWGARQAAGLRGYRLLVVRPCVVPSRDEIDRFPTRGELVVVDRLGAGPGELVLVAHGSRCRDITLSETVPAKDVTVAIVDDAQLTRRAGEPRSGAERSAQDLTARGGRS